MLRSVSNGCGDARVGLGKQLLRIMGSVAKLRETVPPVRLLSLNLAREGAT